MFKKDNITKIMHQHSVGLPAQENFESRRKAMLEYIARYYDNNRDTQELVARLRYLEQVCTNAHHIAACIAGVVLGLGVMYYCTMHFVMHSSVSGYLAYAVLTAAVVYCAYRIMLFVFKHFFSTDPYLTNDYEIRRIKGTLDEQVDEIVRMHLQLSFQNAVRQKD